MSTNQVGNHMVKVVNIHLEEDEHDMWTDMKGDRTWKEVLEDGVYSKISTKELNRQEYEIDHHEDEK